MCSVSNECVQDPVRVVCVRFLSPAADSQSFVSNEDQFSHLKTGHAQMHEHS
jgi:hypothetical protein